ncbi:MAG TPA: hypothetical protein VFZ59_07005 [Verrucomicrobiae bacterium]|nr:hypothetical protein [Verrucomicrobiae bacterium]
MKRLLGLLLGVAFISAASAQTVTQTFQLRAGWNSIWLEVEPTNSALSAVFENLPVASVWTYVAKDAPVQFIQQQTEAMFNQPGWLSWFPASQPESFLSSLYSAHACRAYLVKLTNAATLNVTGVPVVRPATWVTDSFNLRGFPVNPTQLPTFGTFFENVSAHSGQPVYELQPTGVWQLVSPSTTIKRGEAYWAFCQGASTFQGPTGIELEFGEQLNYGAVLTELVPRLLNNSSSARTVCWRDLSAGTNPPLSYQAFANNRLNWFNLPSPYCLTVDASDLADVRLAIRRTAFGGTNYNSILEVTDDVGTRYLLPLTAQKLLPARASLAAPAGVGSPFAGLWVGSATVTNVNEANSTLPQRLTPTRSPFDLRVLVHVDANGNARLLKEVIQMWQNGTTTNDASGRAVTDRPGRFVLLTDDSLLSRFQGASLRDGVPVGRRISTVSFDFAGGTSNVLAMTGTFGGTGTNACTIVLDENFPTNPFKHRYHPDHDNLDATYQNSRAEAYPVTRQIEFRYSTTDPAGTNSLFALDYGQNILGGVYRENITGLHRTNILAQGTFRLTRVANSPVLNQ